MYNEKVHPASGLVNYCVPAGEAHQKALEIAREINEKVRLNCAVGAVKLSSVSCINTSFALKPTKSLLSLTNYNM